jgi:hypothetical protein
MKKRNVKPWVAVAIAALLLFATGCDEEKNAQLIVRNDLGFDISELSLTGDGDTGNLLGGAIIPTDTESFSVPEEVAPGTYTWHVLYSNSPKQSDQGSQEFELFPGKNHLVLTLAPTF